MSDLPVGWVKTTFGEVTTIIGGGTPPSNEPDNFTTDGGTPWITPSDLSGYKEIYIERGARNLTLQGLRKSSAKLLPVGSVLFSSRAPVGYVAIAAKDVSTNQGFKSFVLPSELDNKYIYFYLRHIKPVAEMMATGTTFKELSGSNTAKLPLVIAPYNEQKRIAEKLDSLLTRLDSCQSHLERVPQILKRFRQSVLAEATSGRLTEDWRHKNGVSDLQHRFKLHECFKIFSGYAFKKSEYSKEGSRLLQIANVSYGKIIWEEQNFIPVEVADTTYSNFKLKPSDIVLALNRPITNGALKVGRLSSMDMPAILYQRVACLRTCIDTNEDYVFFCFQTDDFMQQVEDNLQGSDQPYINTSSLDHLTITLPSLEEQAEIVRRVDKLFAYADRLEARYWSAMERVELLTPSLLAKAFRGELVEQDPNDEPASVLLERIRQARETNSVSSRKTKSADH